MPLAATAVDAKFDMLRSAIKEATDYDTLKARLLAVLNDLLWLTLDLRLQLKCIVLPCLHIAFLVPEYASDDTTLAYGTRQASNDTLVELLKVVLHLPLLLMLLDVLSQNFRDC